MSSLTSTVLSLVFLSAAACSTGAQNTQPRPAQYLPGQILVKFRDGSEGAAAVEQAGATQSKPTPGLVSYVGNLGDELGTPLQVQQLTSGKELLVGIDLRRFSEKLAERLKAMDAVAGTEYIPAERDGPQTAIRLKVSFAADSDAAAALAGAKTTESLDEFFESAGRQLGLSLAYQVNSERELVMLVNMLRATEALAARLGELEEVEYVELNQVMQPMGVRNP